MRRSALDRHRIAASVRALVEEELRHIGWAPPPSFLDRMESFADQLVLWGAAKNLTAHPDDSQEIAFHILDSLAPLVTDAASFGDGVQALDLGSGAGFPAIVLSAATQSHFVLSESRRSRINFLTDCIATLQLRNAYILEGRIETTLATIQGERFDIVTARAFGQVEDFLRTAAPALRRGGLAILFATRSLQIPESARVQGLDDHRRIPYEVRARTIARSRVLAIWRKEE